MVESASKSLQPGVRHHDRFLSFPYPPKTTTEPPCVHLPPLSHAPVPHQHCPPNPVYISISRLPIHLRPWRCLPRPSLHFLDSGKCIYKYLPIPCFVHSHYQPCVEKYRY
ncbi:hypothetical protein EX30DRAFT_263658 [Ascodesmis nigricans]|uniref:Uncharacterized protein n=1 Tax=Ascodesmis nigricans TaxID=341454 RepID=A0A4S2MXL3_9PEZI|nr:hypothetical protein EX30DRAFT_263658 [Ascodesmis nigricans]